MKRTECPSDKYVRVLAKLDLSPEELVAQDMHPGVESSYLASGSITLSVEAQPGFIVKAGDGYQIPPETPHSVRKGPEKSTTDSTFIVEKERPSVETAPAPA